VPVRLGGLQGGFGRVEILLADRLDLHQRLIAPDRSLGLEQLRLGSGQFSLGARQRRLERCRIDLEQQVASLDVGAFLELAAEHDAGHPRTHFGHPYRLDATWQLRHHGEGFGLDRQDIDFTRRGFRPAMKSPEKPTARASYSCVTWAEPILFERRT